jgi:UDP-N-acetylmuramoylalanine--D-glutamate ligase
MNAEPWQPAGRRVLVAGAGVAGLAAAKALLARGAQVTVVDRRDTPALAELTDAGARVVVTDAPDAPLLAGVQEVMFSPGFAPHHPLAKAAVASGLDAYSEPELAWRLRGPDGPVWLGITGTNGKTTTTTMLAGILRAAGLRTAALGNIGVPLVDAQVGYDVLAVELSSFQLYWSRDLAPAGGAWLNLADDHLDWHGNRAEYARAKGLIWRAARDGDGLAAGNLDDGAVSAALGRVAGRTVGWTLGVPAPGQLGVVDGVLVDAAFGDGPTALIEAQRVRPAGAHNVSNALAAAALALAYGASRDAVHDGLAGYVPEPHRNALVTTIDGVSYVDDSKATNPHAAYASLTAYPRVVWVAGGQLKGVDIDDLVARVADRLAGAVVLGIDRVQIVEALARHAPDVPVVTVDSTDDGAMGQAVSAAAALAGPGDTVLLAPAAASLDMFTSYAARGDAFAAAVRARATTP